MRSETKALAVVLVLLLLFYSFSGAVAVSSIGKVSTERKSKISYWKEFSAEFHASLQEELESQKRLFNAMNVVLYGESSESSEVLREIQRVAVADLEWILGEEGKNFEEIQKARDMEELRPWLEKEIALLAVEGAALKSNSLAAEEAEAALEEKENIILLAEGFSAGIPVEGESAAYYAWIKGNREEVRKALEGFMEYRVKGFKEAEKEIERFAKGLSLIELAEIVG